MAFARLAPNEVQSDLGFGVRPSGNSNPEGGNWQYYEGDRTITFWVDRHHAEEGKMPERSVVGDAFDRWDDTPEALLPIQERVRLIKNLHDAFEYLEMRLWVSFPRAAMDPLKEAVIAAVPAVRTKYGRIIR